MFKKLTLLSGLGRAYLKELGSDARRGRELRAEAAAPASAPSPDGTPKNSPKVRPAPGPRVEVGRQNSMSSGLFGSIAVQAGGNSPVDGAAKANFGGK